MKALQKPVVRASSLGEEMDEGRADRIIGVPRKDIAATLQGDFRFVRLNQNMSEHFAANAEHGIIKDAFLGGLADVAR